MTKIKLALILVLVVLISHYTFAQEDEFNSKSVDSITLRIVQSGTLDITGDVKSANLTLYIPQEGVQSLNVVSNLKNTWNYGIDSFGNKVVVIEWKNPFGAVTYQLDIIVKNRVKFVQPAAGIGSDSRYLNETKYIVIDDEIRKLAYPYEKTWENVARLAELVYNTVEYDISMVGQRKSSDWVYENKRGVCVEHANLLTALLRASGIPTRYVVGYAYSSVDKKLIGHTWVEVLDSSGNWIPFDPTWLQGGYSDATHIKTANLLDDSQIDVLSYYGSGSIKWTRGSSQNGALTGDLYADKVDILDYTTKNITSITLSSSDAALGGYGYVKATLSSSVCAINQIKIQSCVDKTKNDVIEFYERERNVYFCGSKEIYWFFDENGRNGYVCPVSVFDQVGSTEEIDVTVSGSAKGRNTAIEGPSTVAVGERFTLRANAPSGFIFYSSEFGINYDTSWPLTIKRTGNYNFYLYDGDSLAIKAISVVEKKEFDLSIKAPDDAEWNETFQVNVTAKNLNDVKYAILRLEFNGRRIEKSLSFLPNEEKKLSFNMTALSTGTIFASLSADTLTTYSTFISVEQPPQKPLSAMDSIIKAISDFFAGIAQFFGNLFK